MQERKITVKPIRDQILVKQDGMREKVGSGLLYAPQGSEEWQGTGTVVAVGPGDYDYTGVFVTPEVKPGDRIYFKRRAGTALLPDIREYESGERKELKDLLMLHYNDRKLPNGKVEMGDIVGFVEEE